MCAQHNVIAGEDVYMMSVGNQGIEKCLNLSLSHAYKQDQYVFYCANASALFLLEEFWTRPLCECAS